MNIDSHRMNAKRPLYICRASCMHVGCRRCGGDWRWRNCVGERQNFPPKILRLIATAPNLISISNIHRHRSIHPFHLLFARCLSHNKIQILNFFGDWMVRVCPRPAPIPGIPEASTPHTAYIDYNGCTSYFVWTCVHFMMGKWTCQIKPITHHLSDTDIWQAKLMVNFRTTEEMAISIVSMDG